MGDPDPTWEQLRRPGASGARLEVGPPGPSRRTRTALSELPNQASPAAGLPGPGWRNDHDGQPETRTGGTVSSLAETELHPDPSRPGAQRPRQSLSIWNPLPVSAGISWWFDMYQVYDKHIFSENSMHAHTWDMTWIPKSKMFEHGTSSSNLFELSDKHLEMQYTTMDISILNICIWDIIGISSFHPASVIG